MNDQPTQPLTDAEPLAIEQWARNMAAFADAVGAVLRYEAETLHEAVTQGTKNAGQTLATAFCALGLDQDGEGQVDG